MGEREPDVDAVDVGDTVDVADVENVPAVADGVPDTDGEPDGVLVAVAVPTVGVGSAELEPVLVAVSERNVTVADGEPEGDVEAEVVAVATDEAELDGDTLAVKLADGVAGVSVPKTTRLSTMKPAGSAV